MNMPGNVGALILLLKVHSSIKRYWALWEVAGVGGEKYGITKTWLQQSQWCQKQPKKHLMVRSCQGPSAYAIPTMIMTTMLLICNLSCR